MKEEENAVCTQEKKGSLESVFDRVQVLDLLGKESIVTNLFQELKENVSEELKKSMRLMSHQIENISYGVGNC